ncbi:hypothetical protein BC826DRAFT_715775 [Russula brevipes]|nr:hypothetical protein BC826DRAFT_715775 [Russula brevipes]
MPVSQPHNVYREQLSSHCLGLALWDPAPNPSINDHVSIGDVGFVRQGVFLRMFNVTLPHDHPSNKKIGEPDPYNPLDPGSFVNLFGSTLTKGDYPSRHVSAEEDPLAATPDDFQVTYECPGVGALLSLPDDAFGQDIIRTKAFENYIRDNVTSWFAWSQKNELGVEHMQDLILVTGYTLTTSWAAVAFCDPTIKSKVSLSAQSHDDGRSS